MMDLREIHDRAKGLAVDMLMSEGVGHLMPLLLGFDDTDSPMPIQFEMPPDPTARDALAIILGRLLKEAGCNRAVFVSETWISAFANEMATKLGKPVVAPSEAFDRKDGLIICSMSAGRIIHTQFEVRQSPDTPRLLELVQSGPEMDTARDRDTQITGRFSNLFGAKPTLN